MNKSITRRKKIKKQVRTKRKEKERKKTRGVQGPNVLEGLTSRKDLLAPQTETDCGVLGTLGGLEGCWGGVGGGGAFSA